MSANTTTNPDIDTAAVDTATATRTNANANANTPPRPTASESTAAEKVIPTSMQSWPEDYDREGTGLGLWSTRIWNNWTYSYMNAILTKGANQNRARKNNNNNQKKKKSQPITNTNTNTNTKQDDGTKAEDDDDEENDAYSDDDEENIHLTSDDLWPVPRQMRSKHLVDKYEYNWKMLMQSNQNNASAPTTTTTSSTNSITTKRQLIKTLWKIATPTFLPAGIFQFISVLLVSTMPLVVRRLLFVLEMESRENVLRHGLKWAFLLTSITFFNGLVTQRYRHQSVKTGIALRSAVVNIVYRHVMMLSPHGKRGLTSGEINNLVAVDSQKLYEVTQEGHLIWALPLSIVLVTWFLCQIMGPCTLIGVAVLIGFLPLIKIVTKRMTEVRAKRVKYSDERVEITCSMLLGMRTTKLNGYESKYQQRVQHARNQELKLLAKEQAWWATTLVMTVSSPVLAMAFTYATYVLTSTPENPRVLTAADTFGVLLLFGALRFPINFAGRLIGSAAQALSAIQRICDFLERPLRDNYYDNDDTKQKTGPASLRLPENATENYDSRSTNSNSEHNNEQKDIPLILTNARFRVGVASEDDATESHIPGNCDSDVSAKKSAGDSNIQKNTAIESGSRDNLSFTVSEFNLELRKGEVMVVCGPVGSGKSTLINGILDEADAIELIISIIKINNAHGPKEWSSFLCTPRSLYFKFVAERKYFVWFQF